MKPFPLLALLAVALSAPAHATDLPKWELGLGVGAMTLPDYRGSDEQHAYLLPVPFVVYRGDRLRADRDGLRGKLFDSDRLELDISLSAGVPVRSNSNDARAGMPDLKPTIEIGPQLVWRIAGSWEDGYRLMARLPIRKVIAIGTSQDAGWASTPTLSFDIFDQPVPGWRFAVSGGPYFGDRASHAYVYDVAPEYARVGRPAYAAKSGYGGAQLTLTLSRRMGRAWFGSFVRGSTVSGAAFEDSPLVRQSNNITAGVSVAWSLWEYAERVDRPVDE